MRHVLQILLFLILACRFQPLKSFTMRGILKSTRIPVMSTWRGRLVRHLQGTRVPLLPGQVSLDASLVSENPELVKSHLQARHVDSSLIDYLSDMKSLRAKRSKFIQEGDDARRRIRELSEEVRKLIVNKSLEAEVFAKKEEVKQQRILAGNAESEVRQCDTDIESILIGLPNLLDDRVPLGTSDADNVIVHTWGDELKKMSCGVDDEYKWHDDIAKALYGSDMPAAVKLSGARFSVLSGDVARLERAVSQYFLDYHCDREYTEVSVPFVVLRSCLEGTGQLPKFEDDLFKVNHTVGEEQAFLSPTGEVQLLNIFRDQILDEEHLPISLVTCSPCFRSEVGAHGRDTRGFFRQHQFHKVELIKICTAESSSAHHELMTAHVESMLQSLKLPFRKVLLCSGDTGFSARICYDLEVWFPGQQAYREIASISNCCDFQSRRMKLRYKPLPSSGEKKPHNQHPHTINGSGVAVGRTVAAILENYQRPDGSVAVPDVLRAYMGGKEIIRVEPDESSRARHKQYGKREARKFTP